MKREEKFIFLIISRWTNKSLDFVNGNTRCIQIGAYPASPAELTRRDKIVRLYIMKIAHENNNDDAAVAS